MDIVWAVILGTAFGFAIHRVGASNPSGVINMLRFKDFHLMRVIFFSIGLASLLVFIGMALGFIELSHLHVKSMTWGVIIGGMIFGLGWGLAGYCPGTAVCALGEGRRDALFFIAGALLGSFIYMNIFEYIKDTPLLDTLFGGKALLANVSPKGEKVIIAALPAVITVLVISVVFMAIAYFLPETKDPEKL